MRYRLILLILVLPVFFTACQEQTSIKKTSPSTKYLNLDFEDFTGDIYPKWWYVDGVGYKGVIDRAVVYNGKASLYMECINTLRINCEATSTFPIEHARGKKLRFTGFIKTEDVKDGYAGLWLSVYSNEKGTIASDNMKERGATNTTPWQQYVIELEIPAEGTYISFGVRHSGTGKAWFDNLQLSLDGKPYLQIKPEPLVPTEQDLKWIRARAIPIKTADPINDHSDLQPLKEIIGNRSIVALGEGTHGTSEFFKMKHRITKFLAEEMGFTVFAIEASMPEAREVNRYVLTGQGDPKKALAGLYFWTWNTREVLAMIQWMREFNRSGKGRIEFFGFDMQFPTVAMQHVNQFVKKTDPSFLNTLTGHYKKIAEIFQDYRKTYDREKTDFEKWHRLASEVYEHLQAHRETYLKSFDTLEVDWVIQDARVVLQGAENFIEGKRSRDHSMADNLDWILKHKPAGTKVVTWAHNAHVSKNIASFKSMGNFLAQRHGDNMIVFAFAFHEGEYTAVGNNGINTYTTLKSEPGSLEWFLKSSGIPNFIIDIRGALKGEKGAQWLKQELQFRLIGAIASHIAFTPRHLANEFDAFIFFEKSTPSYCFRSKKILENQNKTKQKNQ